MTNGAESPADSAHLRRVFGHLPTGVVIITGLGVDGELLGMTIGSFASISLDPPLAGFYIGRASRTWPLMAARGNFCANVLAASQSDLCWRFAKDAADRSRFDGLDIGTSHNGSPVLPGAVATIDCRVQTVHLIGDHDLVVGAVTDLRVLDAALSSMVFFKGKTGDVRLDS